MLLINIIITNKKAEESTEYIRVSNKPGKIIERSVVLTGTNSLISIDLNKYEDINEFTRIDHCWVNGNVSEEDKFYLNLNNQIFSGFNRVHQQRVPQSCLIECALTGSNNTLFKLHVDYGGKLMVASVPRIVQRTNVVDLPDYNNVSVDRVFFNLKNLLKLEFLASFDNDNRELVFSFSQGQIDYLSRLVMKLIHKQNIIF